MKAGHLRHYVNIQHKGTATPDGIGNVTQPWDVLYTNVPTEIIPFSARETWFGATAQSETTHRLIFRYLPGIDTTCRVDFGGRLFDILGIADDQECNVMLTLDCKERF